MASPATALASRVLPVPGGPTSKQPRGIFRAHGLVLGGVGQEVLDLLHLLDGLVHAGDVGEAHVGALLDALLGLGLAEVHLRVIRLRHLVEQEEQHGADEDDGQQRGEDVAPRLGVFTSYLISGCWAIRSDSELRPRCT